MSTRSQRIEVITRGERRRWSVEQKREIDGDRHLAALHVPHHGCLVVARHNAAIARHPDTADADRQLVAIGLTRPLCILAINVSGRGKNVTIGVPIE